MSRPAAVALAAAFHEAGHAVASWRQGDGIGSVSIEPHSDPDTGSFTGGRFTLLRGGNRSVASGWGHRHLVVLLAGAAAQHRHDPLSAVLSCAAADFDNARAFATVMARSREAERALLTWAQAEARALIATDWNLVEVLAFALIDAAKVDGARVVAILAAAETAGRGALGPSPPGAGLRPIKARVLSSLSAAEKP